MKIDHKNDKVGVFVSEILTRVQYKNLRSRGPVVQDLFDVIDT